MFTMAQFTPKLHWFEQSWRPRLNLAARLLQDFQDRWLRSDDPFPSKEVVAVLLNVFSFDFYKADFLTYAGVSADELWARSLDEWLCSVESPKSECSRLCPNQQESEYLEVVESFCAALSNAAESWERNAPNAISCLALVEWIVDELVTRRFVVIKYG